MDYERLESMVSGGGRGPVTLLVRLHVNVRQRQVYSLGDEKGL